MRMEGLRATEYRKLWFVRMVGGNAERACVLRLHRFRRCSRRRKRPESQKDMPIGLLGSLIVCTILYIVVSGLLTATVHYSHLIRAPCRWPFVRPAQMGSYVINAGASLG